MEAIKRKRVTRVGSGAFSIYLPKKWIDAWPPEQQEKREVDLHLIDQSLLIVPAIVDAALETTIEPSKRAVRRWLLSAYLRGMNEVTLLPEGGRFDNGAITAGRDFLRHLDERLVATCAPDRIAYTLNIELPPPAATGHDLLMVLGAKVREMIGLAEEAVSTYSLDPERALHALALLQAIHEEDASRYFHQAVRMVATIELPLNTVSDFQVLDLLAADLHRMADHALRIGSTVLSAYGLTLDDLEYPREHLAERIGTPPTLTGVAREIVHTYRRSFTDVTSLFDDFVASLRGPDIPAMADLIGRSHDVQEHIQERIFRAVLDHWGEGDAADPETAMAGFRAFQLSVPLSDIVGAIGTAARHGVGLLTAAGAGKRARKEDGP